MNMLSQELLQWLDELTEDLADDGGSALEEELQLAVEAALKVQAQRVAGHGTQGTGVSDKTRRPSQRSQRR